MLREAAPTRSILAERFEGEIREFLRTMGFKHVEGGRTFKLGGVQVDAAGGYGDVYVAVECHTRFGNRSNSIRTKIRSHRGVKADLLRGLREKRKLWRYSRLRLVVCTKKIQHSSVDKGFASRRPTVFLWDDRFVGYYRQLAGKVGRSALYSLLGELQIKPTAELAEGDFRVPAFKTRIRGKTLYSFWADPEILLRIAFVARREVGHEAYYQRILKGDRLKDIAEYVSDRRKSALFPNSIILNFKSRPKFTRMRLSSTAKYCQYGWLTLPDDFCSAWVIDGQHRLYSFTIRQAARNKIPLPVVAFSDLPEEQQAAFFLTINNEQKPVNPNLLWDLEATVHPDLPHGIIAGAVKGLEQSGPLHGLVSYPYLGSHGEGRSLTLANICKSIYDRSLVERQTEHMTPRTVNPLFARSPRKRRKKLEEGLAGFVTAVKAAFEKDWVLGKKGFICTNNGMAVLLRVFERYLVFRPKRPRLAEMLEIFEPLAEQYYGEYDSPDKLKELRGRGSSEGGRGALANEFCAIIRQTFMDFAKDVELAKPLEASFAEFESRFKQDIARRMGGSIDTWWASIAEKVRNRAERRSPGKALPWLRLTLGEWKDYLAQEVFWNSHLREACIGIHDSQARFLGHYSELVELRNLSQHGAPLTDHDIERARFLLREFWKVIAAFEKLSGESSGLPEPAPACWMTPVKSDETMTAEETIATLVGEEHVYAFGENTPGRGRMRPGDLVCFYATKVGVVAHARLKTRPEWKRHPRVRKPDQYPYMVHLDDPELYIDRPIAINDNLRAQLDAFRGRTPKKDWAWFVQGTRKITEHDFFILTRGSNAKIPLSGNPSAPEQKSVRGRGPSRSVS